MAVSGFSMFGIQHTGFQVLDLSYNYLNAEQVLALCERVCLSSQCSLVTLKLAKQRFDNDSIEPFCKFVKTSRTLQDLNLTECKLGDTYAFKIFNAWIAPIKGNSRGELTLSSNLLRSPFPDDGRKKSEEEEELLQPKHEIQMEPLSLKKVDLSGNSLNDQAIASLTLLLLKERVKIERVDLSRNQLGKQTLVELREFMEGCPELSFETIDLSENLPILLKSTSLLEMR